MNFQVPQFIEVENKIFGPLSFPQFIFVVGGLAVAFLLYVSLPLYIALVPMAIAIAGGLGLAFYKLNNRSLIYVIQSMLKYYLGSKLYIWQKGSTAQPRSKPVVAQAAIDLPKISESRLDQLSWSLDVKEHIN